MDLNRNRKKLSSLLGVCPTVESEYLFAFGTELTKNVHPKLVFRRLLARELKTDPAAAPFLSALRVINTTKRRSRSGDVSRAPVVLQEKKTSQNPFSVFVPDMILVGFEANKLGPLVLSAAAIIRAILDRESKNIPFDDEAILSAIDFYLHVVKKNAGSDPDVSLEGRADSLLRDALGIGFGS